MRAIERNTNSYMVFFEYINPAFINEYAISLNGVSKFNVWISTYQFALIF